VNLSKLVCLNCGSKGVRLVYAYLRRVAGLMRGKFQIRCADCGRIQTVHVTGTRGGMNVLRMVRGRKVVGC
jgi:hypothetical protein